MRIRLLIDVEMTEEEVGNLAHLLVDQPTVAVASQTGADWNALGRLMGAQQVQT